MTAPRSVLIIGSGPIVIGQAAEFDYSGTQACLACRQAGVHTILVNSNPATIGTDPEIADTVYIEPLTVETIESIIARKRPDGIIATAGGQTALNLAVALDAAGVLDRYGVRLLGTGLEAIARGEDRALFAETLRAAGQPILPSHAVTSIAEARVAAADIGYPVMCRSAFALGGAGSGFATNEEELNRQVAAGLRSSGSGQVLIEKSVYGWTEVEYEVIRDSAGNCLVVCNMENFDPMGVHTGDSIVVAPSQTLSDGEYHLLRAAARAVVGALGVEGACNVQFALDRDTGAYYVIEVNPRLSRSSALASKATGYPIAKVAARIALGLTLPEIRNDITGTSAFFEPALDYVVVKIPRWPFDKFRALPARIGTSMRSTGEVMAIGRTFEEAIAKAIRGLERGSRPLPAGADLEAKLIEPHGDRLSVILAALRAGWTPERIAALTRIHPWFLYRLAALLSGQRGVVGAGRGTLWVSGPPLPSPEWMDNRGHQGGRRLGAAPTDDSTDAETTPYVFKMVDTCAGEFEARTPYFYGTHVPGGVSETTPLDGPHAIILGSGPIRIGQGIEFDYAAVHACKALSAAGVRSIIINNNPETVSTDYSTSDRLYFEPLDEEAVMAVVANEADGLLGVIPQFGGQTAIGLVAPLHAQGVPILGTQPDAIDAAEDRARCSRLLQEAGIPAPPWQSVDRWEDVPETVDAVGYPALLRPSYVLSGRGMVLVRSRADVDAYLAGHAAEPLTTPLLIDHFLDGAIELDVDAVCDGEKTVAVIMEQLEECGVHSGDSAEVYPVQTVSPEVLATVEAYTRTIARAFGIRGLMNVQYAVRDGQVFVLEVNPRASRSVPFAAKASGIPLADLAVQVILGRKLRDLEVPAARRDRVCVKEVVLPFGVFPALPPVLGPEMQSTGEAMGMSLTFAGAYWKAELGAGWRTLPFGKPAYVAGTAPDLPEALSLLAAAGCPILASPSGAVAVTHASPVAIREPETVDPGELGLAIVLDRSPAALDLLRRCVDARAPYLSSPGGVRGLLLALRESLPDLTPITLSESVSAPLPGMPAARSRLEPVAPDVESLESLLTQITDDNIHAEIDFGPAVGREVW